MRYIIYGAGAVGGTIGAKLHLAGRELVLICRGEHYAKVKESGLVFQTPLSRETFSIPIVEHPRELNFSADDVVLITMKSQHTIAALETLRECAPDVPIVCAQNSVVNERMAARRFAQVYAMLVYLPATLLTPGLVQAYCAPISGVLDAGCYPNGVDERIKAVCNDIAEAGFSCQPRVDVMRWKYEKLLSNLGNIVQAACGVHAEFKPIVESLRTEGIACYRAAGIDWATPDETAERRKLFSSPGKIEGTKRAGGSTWQSLSLGKTSIETDYLNGEIVLLGRQFGVPTPGNMAMQSIGARMVRDRLQPGAFTVQQLQEEIELMSRRYFS